MHTAPTPRLTYRFGDCEFDVSRFELRRKGETVKLEKIPMELLLLLLENEGRLVTRPQILERLWGPNVFVDAEQGINTAVRKIRLAIMAGDAAAPDPVQTIVGKGYRFALPIEVVGTAPAAPTTAQPKPLFPRPFLIGLALFFAFIAGALVLVHFRNPASSPNNLTTSPAPTSITSIAVLPFDNFSGDPREDYFVDGTTDAIITRVAQLGTFKVISRTSVMKFKGAQRNLRDIANELHVDAVVEGSVVRDGKHVRITAQLIDARSDRHLWAEQYERDFSEILRLQDDIAIRIASSVDASIGTKLRPSPASSSSPRVWNDRATQYAYEKYLRARAAAQLRTPASLAQAINDYQSAFTVYPVNLYAQVPAGLADAYAAMGYNSFSAPDRSFMPAEKLAQLALRDDPDCAEAHAALGYTRFYYDWNVAAAEKEFDAALRANPSHAVTHHWRSVLLTSEGKYSDAEREIALARNFDPLSIPIDSDVGFELYYAGRYDEAIQHLRNVLTVAPDFPGAHLWLGRAYEQKQMYADSIRELERANQLAGEWSVAIAALGHARAVSGDRAGAALDLDHLNRLAGKRYVTPYAYAVIYAGLNDGDNSFRWLERAYNERSHWLVWLRTDPRFANLRHDPRFQQLVEKIANSSR